MVGPLSVNIIIYFTVLLNQVFFSEHSTIGYTRWSMQNSINCDIFQCIVKSILFSEHSFNIYSINMQVFVFYVLVS